MKDGSAEDHGTPDRLGDRSPEVIETVAAIMVEVRDTAPMAEKGRIEEMIRERLDRAGVGLTDEDVAELAKQLTEGVE